ncbi:hypothetical protein [Anaerosalibacter bizertensis]|nr:hypothetical protein [Anaerosalibacter bizertensis]
MENLVEIKKLSKNYFNKKAYEKLIVFKQYRSIEYYIRDGIIF